MTSRSITKVQYFNNMSSSIQALNTSYSNDSFPILSSISLPNERLEKIAQKILFVERLTIQITLIVSIIGLIGNACTIVILNRQSMRKWRSSVLLSSLAIVDFLYLFIIFLSIIDELTNYMIGLNRSLVLCQSTVYITHVCSFLSANFTLSFTLQRFVAVIFPLHAHKVISYRSSFINILVLLILACSFYSFSFFVTNVSSGQCREDETYPALFPLLIVDTCLTFVLPFIFIVIFNCAIVYKLQQRKRFSGVLDGSIIKSSTFNRGLTVAQSKRPTNDQLEQEDLMQANVDMPDDITSENGVKTSDKSALSIRKLSKASSEATPKLKHTSRMFNPRSSVVTVINEIGSSTSTPASQQGVSQRTTKMLVICSTTFLLFNSPYCAVLLYSIISKVVLIRVLGILRHFYFMSFCLNFFLYSLCGNRFRQEFISMLQTCSRYFRFPWSSIDKIQKQTHFSRINTRTAV